MILDLLDPAELPPAIDRALSELGGVDVLVNNAGAAPFDASRVDSHWGDDGNTCVSP